MTYGDIQDSTPEEERIYYVYMWYTEKDNTLTPFYIGMGSGERYKTKGRRSKAFLEYVKQHEDCKSIKLVDCLALEVARFLEVKAKEMFKEAGCPIIDGEDDKAQRKYAQRKGIDAMPVVNGKKISSRTGRPTGRPPKPVEYVLEDGETVKAACDRLGISRTQWYREIKKQNSLPSTKSTSCSTAQTLTRSADTGIVSHSLG